MDSYDQYDFADDSFFALMDALIQASHGSNASNGVLKVSGSVNKKKANLVLLA